MRDIAVSHRLASHTTAPPYANDYYNPARILALCGGTGPTHGISTYSGGNNIAVATPLTGKVDDSRTIGKTNVHYMKTGTLDFVSEIGNAACENKVVTTITTPKIDHAPVVARSTPVSSDLSEFERTQKFVVDTIRGLAVVLPPDLKSAYEAQLSDLKMLSDTPENRETVAGAFNFYTKILNDFAMPAEIARMESNVKMQSILQAETVKYVTIGMDLFNELISETDALPPLETLSAELLDEANDLRPVKPLPAEIAALFETGEIEQDKESDRAITPFSLDATEPYFSDSEDDEAPSPAKTVAAKIDDEDLDHTVSHTAVLNDSIETVAAEMVRTAEPKKTRLDTASSEPLVFNASSFFQTPEQHAQHLQKKSRTEEAAATEDDENVSSLPLEAKQ